jgi:hypothetical protein
MCKNATSTAASLMAAIEPTIVLLLKETGVADTPNGQSAISAYNAALAAIKDWKSGTSAQNVLQVITTFQSVFNTLPIPASYITLTNIILAGVEAVIGVLTANSPAPTPETGLETTASGEELTTQHQLNVASDTEKKVLLLVPGFKRSIWHSPAHQYKQVWNKAVESGNFSKGLQIK